MNELSKLIYKTNCGFAEDLGAVRPVRHNEVTRPV